jgi:hypothetical protein
MRLFVTQVIKKLENPGIANSLTMLDVPTETNGMQKRVGLTRPAVSVLGIQREDGNSKIDDIFEFGSLLVYRFGVL